MQSDLSSTQKKEKISISSDSLSKAQEILSHNVLLKNQPIYEDEDGSFRADVIEVNGKKEVYLHLDLFNWNQSVYDKVLLGLDTFNKAMKKYGVDDMFIVIPPDDEKMLKFDEMIGFELYEYVLDNHKNIIAFKLRYEG